MLVKYGSFTGDGTDNRSISGVGFQPNLVILQRVNGSAAYLYCSLWATDTSKPVNNVSIADYIQAIEADGFQVGVAGNPNGIVHHYLAVKAAAADFALLSYTGNATDDRSISGVGFQPDMVMIFALPAWSAVNWRNSDFVGDVSGKLTGPNNVANLIQALEADGFQIGTDDAVNFSGATYYALCFKLEASVFGKLQYTGNGADNRSISGLGFAPDGGWTKSYSFNVEAVDRFKDEAGDASMVIGGAASEAANQIQALESDGFQVGTAEVVNSNGVVFNTAWWKDAAGTVSATMSAAVCTASALSPACTMLASSVMAAAVCSATARAWAAVMSPLAETIFRARRAMGHLWGPWRGHVSR